MKRSGPIKRRTRLRPMSSKRQREAKLYSAKRKAFLEAHPWCQIWLKRYGFDEISVCEAYDFIPGSFVLSMDGERFVRTWDIPRSVDVHHRCGRVGKNYLDESTWLAASREQHEWVHSHPSEARLLGLLK